MPNETAALLARLAYKRVRPTDLNINALFLSWPEIYINNLPSPWNHGHDTTVLFLCTVTARRLVRPLAPFLHAPHKYLLSILQT